MPLIAATDPDFIIARIAFDTLVVIQQEAEAHGIATRWSSEAALRGQVKPGPVLLQSLMREMRGDTVRAVRCLVAFASPDPQSPSGVVTLDLTPARFASLDPIARTVEARQAFAHRFALVENGARLIPKA